ncbi:MAG: VOC family protein [Actinomycetota bacterium]
MGNPVVHFEIGTSNAADGQSFYSELFDWKINADNPADYGIVDTGAGSGIGGGILQTRDDMPQYVTFYVAVDDVQAYLDKAEGLGAKTVVPVTEIPDMVTFALFTDPQGNLVGIVKDQPQ